MESGVKSKVRDDPLSDWRRKAADVVIVASAFLNLPTIIFLQLGYPPAVAWFVTVMAMAGYAILLAAALLRCIDYRIRVWAMLCILYLVASGAVVALPQGPVVRILPIIAPILAIGLIGIRAARVAMLISAGILIFVPFLHFQPDVTRLFGIDPSQATAAPGFTLAQGLGLTANMVIVMVLLERFYKFLLQALNSQRQATAELGAANRKLEGEIHERRRLEHEITHVGDEERRRVGYEIHDGICQQLTGALLRCQALNSHLDRGAAPPREEVGALTSLLGQTIDEAHAVAQGLCPLAPDPDALAPGLRALAKRMRNKSGVRCEYSAAGDVRVPDATTAHHLYRIAQEALSNAFRHSHAVRITVELRGSEDSLTLRVEDDGVGLNAEISERGMGLRAMEYRAQIISGEFKVERGPAGGTCISCRIPRSALAEAEHRDQLADGGN